jgi:uncharacterized protein (TIGR00369 family)
MKFYSDGEAVVSCLAVPDHLCGWDRLVHGGVLSTILDEIMSWTAIRVMKRFILTKSMQVEFLKPVVAGEPIRAEGRLHEVRGKREAVMKATICNGDGQVCARAEGTFAVFNREGIRKLGLVSEEALRTFEDLIRD